MRRPRANNRLVHQHPCAACLGPVLCDGELERNVDGEPPVICAAYHLPGGEKASVICWQCRETAKADNLREAGEHA